jgi:putative SOS response-associated peptidase YedK
MCGRFTSHHSPEEIMERFEVDEELFRPDPRYNIAPTQIVASIIELQGKRLLTGFRWGLVPAWSKDPAIGNRMINARAETILDKPSFKPLLTKKRCLIPADGFYEWKTSAGGKQPFHIRRQDGGLFAFAGLWEENGSRRMAAPCKPAPSSPWSRMN